MPKLSVITQSLALLLSVISLMLALGTIKPVPQSPSPVAPVSSDWTYPIDHGGMG